MPRGTGRCTKYPIARGIWCTFSSRYIRVNINISKIFTVTHNRIKPFNNPSVCRFAMLHIVWHSNLVLTPSIFIEHIFAKSLINEAQSKKHLNTRISNLKYWVLPEIHITKTSQQFSLILVWHKK